VAEVGEVLGSGACGRELRESKGVVGGRTREAESKPFSRSLMGEKRAGPDDGVIFADVINRPLRRRRGCWPLACALGTMAPPPAVGLSATALRGEEHIGPLPLVGMLVIAFNAATS